MGKTPTDFFTKEAAERYDERNSKLSSISDCLHFLTHLVLKNISPRARILCAGVGTGAEMLSLSRVFSEWTFVALDPSQSMLDVCRERAKAAGILDRCEFVHGYVQDLPSEPKFDAVLSILVAHFIKREERLSFFRHLSDRLVKGGYLVNAEISFDLDSLEFPAMLKNWESVQSLMGGTPESLATLPKQLREILTVLPPAETEKIIQQSGINLPIKFFQALMISAWYGKKTT